MIKPRPIRESAYDLFCIFSKDYVGKESVETKQSSQSMDGKFSCL